MKNKIDKLLDDLKSEFDSQEKRNKTAEEYKQAAKKRVVETFNSNIIYWIDGYSKILEECGVTDRQMQSKILGKIRKHQEDGIAKWIDFELDLS